MTYMTDGEGAHKSAVGTLLRPTAARSDLLNVKSSQCQRVCFVFAVGRDSLSFSATTDGVVHTHTIVINISSRLFTYLSLGADLSESTSLLLLSVPLCLNYFVFRLSNIFVTFEIWDNRCIDSCSVLIATPLRDKILTVPSSERGELQ